MPAGETNQTSMTWLIFALMTVVCWGVYGIFLHWGSTGMNVPGSPPDPNGRIKAFLIVGLAYFLTAVLAPIAFLLVKKADWTMPAGGMGWSLVAGIVGAIGAFCVLLAFGAKGTPAVVMTIVFAGAPIVNAVVGIGIDRNWGNVHWQFALGIVLAAVGGGLVTFYKPPPKPHAVTKPASAVAEAAPPEAAHR